jgi:hypothetical protein
MSIEVSKRAEANRRNARKSTGPRTAAGKDRSRFNAVKHGLSAKVEVLPGEDSDAFRARLESWTANLQPRDEIERYLVERAVHVSWQLDRADRAQAARVADVRYAGTVKAGDLADEVAALGRRLFWDPRGPGGLYDRAEVTAGDAGRPFWSMEIDDPNDPPRLVNRLEGSALGCAWLLDCWGELRTTLEEGRKWQPIDRLRAVRLLGKQPLDAADDRQVMSIYLACRAMDPDGPHAFADVTSGLLQHERERFLEQLDARGAMSRLPADPETAMAAMLDLIADEEVRLEELLTIHLEREEAAGERLAFDDSDSGEWLRRYQLTFNRTLLRILETLRKRRKESGGAMHPVPTSGRRIDPDRREPAVGPARGPLVTVRPESPGPALRPTDTSVGRGSPDPAHRPTGGLPDSFGHAPFVSAPLPAKEEAPRSVGRGSPDPAHRPTGGLPDSVGHAPFVPAPLPAKDDAPRQSQNAKNEPNETPRTAVRPGDPMKPAPQNSKNEPIDPPATPRRRASEVLAALFGLLGMVLAALLTPAVAMQPRPDPGFSVLGAPAPRATGTLGHLIPRSTAETGPTALIPISRRARSSPS